MLQDVRDDQLKSDKSNQRNKSATRPFRISDIIRLSLAFHWISGPKAFEILWTRLIVVFKLNAPFFLNDAFSQGDHISTGSSHC